MKLEVVATALVLGLALLPLLARARRAGSTAAGVVGWLTVCAAVAWAGFRYQPGYVPEEAVPDRPIQVRDEGFVSSRACAACHPREYATWRESYHSRMTQVVSPQTVLAPFEDLTFQYGATYKLERRGDEFWVVSNDRHWLDPGATQGFGARRIVMSTGSHHFQLYWFSTHDAREVKLFPFAYLLHEKRWVPFGSILLMEAGYPTDFAQWNVDCLRCHATHARPRSKLVQGRSTSPDTRVAEFGIGCESCHGPGEEHVRRNRDPERRYLLHVSDDGDPSIVQPARLSSRRASEVCGSCHSVHTFHTVQGVEDWVQHGFAFRPGDELEHTRYLMRPEENPLPPAAKRLLAVDPHFIENRYWPDGVPSAGGREYSSMMRAPCFQRGELSCLSCHQLHQSASDPRPFEVWADDQLAVGMRGNEACLQCHEKYRSGLEAHTHHPESSAGSNCYNCHMPHTNYGLMKNTRDHAISSPDLATTLATGRPNACNLCHLDRSLGWTAEALQRWYGAPPPQLDPDQRTRSDAVLRLLYGDAAERALMAWHMGWKPAQEASGTDWLAPYLAQLLVDPYDVVRDLAGRSLRSLPPFAGLDYDYLALPEVRDAARQQVVSAWDASAGERSPRPPVLIGEQGRLEAAEFERLLGERDDRAVRFVE